MFRQERMTAHNNAPLFGKPKTQFNAYMYSSIRFTDLSLACIAASLALLCFSSSSASESLPSES